MNNDNQTTIPDDEREMLPEIGQNILDDIGRILRNYGHWLVYILIFWVIVRWVQSQ